MYLLPSSLAIIYALTMLRLFQKSPRMLFSNRKHTEFLQNGYRAVISMSVINIVVKFCQNNDDHITTGDVLIFYYTYAFTLGTIYRFFKSKVAASSSEVVTL
jgi:hypothetical protein